MPDRVNNKDEISGVKGLRGKGALNVQRDYTTKRVVKPRRVAERDRALSGSMLEQRAANVAGTILERIVFKRLSAIWGRPEVDFVYKYQLSSVDGVKNAR